MHSFPTSTNGSSRSTILRETPRCIRVWTTCDARLSHNYLALYAWLAEGRPAVTFPGNDTLFTVHGAAADALRPRLDSSMAAFLSAAVQPAQAHRPPCLFFWTAGLSDPEDLFNEQLADLFDQPEDSMICLYPGWLSGAGLFYHQAHHHATFFEDMVEYDFALPAEDHQSLWHPLETVLSNWIGLVQLGKITAPPAEGHPNEDPGLQNKPWVWQPYSEAQVAACVVAWEQLCNAIEARILPSPNESDDAIAAADAVGPLLTPIALDAASIPEPSFARAFLTRAHRPPFRFIAPGLALPPAGAQDFAAMQFFTALPRDSTHAIPPVCLFPSSERDKAQVAGPGRNPFCWGFNADSSAPSHVPAGVYSEAVQRADQFDFAEEGFRLLLPFDLKGGGYGDTEGARKSDGSFVGPETATELFQHGFKPFGGGYGRAQRLERLFDQWHKLIVEGIWSVGSDGVKGTMDTFREADTRWTDYCIVSTW